MISLAYGTAGIAAGWNETHMADPKLDQMLVAARTEFDVGKRRQLYYDMQTLIADTGGEIIPVIADYVDATSTGRCSMGTLGNDFDMDGGRFAERWWFA